MEQSLVTGTGPSNEKHLLAVICPDVHSRHGWNAVTPCTVTKYVAVAQEGSEKFYVTSVLPVMGQGV